ncbi:hypothetical protein [Vampirovibrio sp.]|uniref:hypothetical protein n=1 Tax=Vampirovibrio sp. TaxID=2717857 RepID=UPI003592EF65
MSILPFPMAMNPFSQKLLAQSVNLSYAGRGVYRVSETQPSRKGDYWFRDFGMVMACTYMTEMGFRGTERFYTMPLLTSALELHALNTNQGQKQVIPDYKNKNQLLSAKALYPNAFNYTDMPDALRKKMMGTVIRNSADLVPQTLQQEALKEISELKVDSTLKAPFKAQLKSLIEKPMDAQNASKVGEYLGSATLKPYAQDLKRIAKLDNQTAVDVEIGKLLASKKESPGINVLTAQVQNGVRLIKAQQLGFLLNHLDRTLNFQHYLESNFLEPKDSLKSVGSVIPRHFEMPRALMRQNKFSPLDEMGEIVSDRLQFYVGKLDSLQSKAKTELRALAEEVRKLPLDQRDDVFSKKIGAIENLQFLYKKESLTDFWHVGPEDRTAMQEIYKELYSPENFNHELKNSANQGAEGKWAQNSVNWENEFKVQKDRLREFLIHPPEHSSTGPLKRHKGYISPNQLNTQLSHFEGWFETMAKSQEVRHKTLDNLWRYLGADMMLQVKKKVKVAFEEVNKLSFDYLPETHASMALRKSDPSQPAERVSKQQLLAARLEDMGLGRWLEPHEIVNLSKDLERHLPKMPANLEQHSVEPVMDKVKKTIWAHLTGTVDWATLKKVAPELKKHLDHELEQLKVSAPEQHQAAQATQKVRGKLFRHLTSTNAFCVEAKDLGGKPAFSLETLLKPLFQTHNLHDIQDEAGNLVKSAEWTFKSLIEDGKQSRAIKSAVDKIQRNGTWPKMIATVALNFIFYGWLASRFDNKVLQPYEEKLVARKGTSQDIVTAGYLGLLPAGVVLSQMFDAAAVPVFKQMNHFTRFASVGGAALATFAGSTYGFLKLLEKNTPPLPGYPQARQSNASQIGFKSLASQPLNRPVRENAPALGNAAFPSSGMNSPFASRLRPTFSLPLPRPESAAANPFITYP